MRLVSGLVVVVVALVNCVGDSAVVTRLNCLVQNYSDWYSLVDCHMMSSDVM